MWWGPGDATLAYLLPLPELMSASVVSQQINIKTTGEGNGHVEAAFKKAQGL